MKTLYKLLAFFSIALAGCSDSVLETVTYQINEPIFMDAASFRSSVKVTEEPHQITNYGKIAFYEGYLYISEPEKGIHIVDNTNTKSPRTIGYIELIGNADLAIRDGKLYADSYIDLVWFDVSNPEKPALKGRLENVFESALPMVDNNFAVDYYKYWERDNDEIVVGWELKERTEEIEKYRGSNIQLGWGWAWGRENFVDFASLDGAKGGNGLNGSMSRFGLYNGYLYTVINNYMSIFSLDSESPKRMIDNKYVGWNVETIFSYKDNLFMGTPTGMLIYSVKDPLNPQFMSAIQHVFGCDPVVVEDELAYVTIRSGNTCGQGENKLFVIDVKDVQNPKQIASYDMTNPKGLGIDKGILFICDEGLKIFNANKPTEINKHQLAHYKGMDGFDVIPFNNTLMMIADDGLYQYDYSDINNIQLLSKLAIGN